MSRQATQQWPRCLFVLLLWLPLVWSASGFAPRFRPSTNNINQFQDPSSSRSKSKSRPSTTKRQATVEFKGESTTSIEVPLPSSSSSTRSRSLPHWMLSSESDPFFLGTREFRQRTDGAWDAFLPHVDWFGLELVPVFVIQMQRSDRQVSALITDARSEIRSGHETRRGKLVSRVMTRSTFRGGNTVEWQDNGDRGWTLKADLSLTLSIPLPAFLPIPPGFNSIGSRIVKSTCKSRLEKFVVSLQESYLEWAEKHNEAEVEKGEWEVKR